MITLQTIALESKTLAEYARRAEAWNSVEAVPHSDSDLVNMYLTCGHAPGDARQHHTKIRKAIKIAREIRLGDRVRLWSVIAANL
jgi:hypothetical protein